MAMAIPWPFLHAHLPLPPILCKLVFRDSFGTRLGADIQACNHWPCVSVYPNDQTVAHESGHGICRAGTQSLELEG